eukprot:scaffold91490_cov23-Phaeocystis_antarctica.AAC.1
MIYTELLPLNVPTSRLFQVEFRAMLFLPSTVPWELSQDMFNEKVTSLKLEPSHNPTIPPYLTISHHISRSPRSSSSSS